MKPWHLTAHTLDESQRVVTGDVPSHVGEHCVADVLQCDVEVVAHIVVLRHHRQNVPRELRGVGIVQPYPLHAIDGCHLFHQFGKHHFAIEVKAVARQVLRNHVEFLHATAHEVARLVKQLLHGHTFVAARDERYGAEGAEAVTALRDFHVGVVVWCGENAVTGEVIAVALAQVIEHLLPVELAVEVVHFGQLVDEVGHETLAEASHHE